MSVRAAWIAIVLLPLAGCTARHVPGPLQTSAAFQVKRVSYWLRAPRTTDPLPATLEVTRAGADVYANACAVCHGADGKGTPLGLAMYPPATDLTSRIGQGYSDRELYFLLWNGIGHTGMPAWNTLLKPEQVWQVMHYMRTLPNASKPTPDSDAAMAEAQLAARGRAVFLREGCSSCHKLGDGPEGDSPNLTYEGDRGRSREWLVGHFIAPSAYSPGSDMPSYGKLSGDDLDALAVFLNSLRKQGS